MLVGTTKDQGLYNKLSAAVHSGALAAGTLPQHNTIQYSTLDSCRIVMKPEFCRHCFTKYSVIGRFNEFRLEEAQVFHAGGRDRNDEAC